MEDNIENTASVIKYWKDSSNDNYITMNNLLKTKDYNWALFLGHLVIEKLLKGLYVQKFQKHAFFTHDLLRLAQKIEIDTTAEQEEWFDQISTFNLNARYDNYKQDFQKLCTKEFTKTWIERIEILREWLIQML
jgi:HEPN domain-containing protein